MLLWTTRTGQGFSTGRSHQQFSKVSHESKGLQATEARLLFLCNMQRQEHEGTEHRLWSVIQKRELKGKYKSGQNGKNTQQSFKHFRSMVDLVQFCSVLIQFFINFLPNVDQLKLSSETTEVSHWSNGITNQLTNASKTMIYSIL